MGFRQDAQPIAPSDATALAALLLSAGGLQVVPAASILGVALLLLIAGLLVVPRRADDECEA